MKGSLHDYSWNVCSLLPYGSFRLDWDSSFKNALGLWRYGVHELSLFKTVSPLESK